MNIMWSCSPGQISELVVSNDRMPNLEILKTDAITGKPVEGVTFTVKRVDSSTLTTVTSDANGRCFLEKLMPGVYEIWEQSVPDGYLLNEEHQLITLFPNRTGTVQFQNYPKPTLTVNKIDSITADPIKGAKFSVTYRSNNTSTGEIRDLGTFYSDENGQFKLDKLDDGWYTITELEPAAGYSIKEPASQEVYIEAGRAQDRHLREYAPVRHYRQEGGCQYRRSSSGCMVPREIPERYQRHPAAPSLLNARPAPTAPSS